MPRKKILDRRSVAPDPRFNSVLVAKFTNGLMVEGKKTVARRLFYDAMEIIQGKVSDQDPLTVFEEAMENVRPRVEVKSRRVGGATYQVPLEVSLDRQEALAMRWIVNAARGRRGTPMHIALANEIRDASTNQGVVVRKRDETHKMAQANRAFAHFRW